MAKKRGPRLLIKGTPVTKESSRWHTGGPGHFPSYSSENMRRMAAAGLGEMHSMQREVSRMSRTHPEDVTAPTPRVVITLGDITFGLGLELSDEQRIQQLVNTTSPGFSQKTQTPHLMHAKGRLLSVLRDSMKHVSADTREEVVKRSMAYWKRHFQTDYGKSPTIRFRGGEARKSMISSSFFMRFVIPADKLFKAGPFIGPKGGKWADAKHTIPYKEGGAAKPKAGKKAAPGEISPRKAKSQAKQHARVMEVIGNGGREALGGIPIKPKDIENALRHASRIAPDDRAAIGRYAANKAPRMSAGGQSDMLQIAHNAGVSEQEMQRIWSKTSVYPLPSSKGWAKPLKKALTLVRLRKAGPFIGPKGGKWSDAKHTIPYKEGTAAKPKGTATDFDPAKNVGELGRGTLTPKQEAAVTALLREEGRAKPKKQKRPTFKAAKGAILDHLKEAGWDVKTHSFSSGRWAPLKVPHATHDDGTKLWFKAQAVYVSHGSSRLGDARSVHADIRDRDPAAFVSAVHKSLTFDLKKAVIGGKYYRRTPNPGYVRGAKGARGKKYRYYYTREQYDKAHVDTAHRNGGDEQRRGYLKKMAGTTDAFKAAIDEGKITGSLGAHVRIAKNVLRAHNASLPALMDTLRDAAPEGADIKSRVKKLESVLGKMVRKPKYKTAASLQDATGARIVCNSIAEVKSTVAKLRAEYKVIEEDNYIDKALGDYRSHHLIIEHDGLAKEVQIRTRNQNVFADWSHNVYKPRSEEQLRLVTQSAAEISSYSKQASDHFFSADSDDRPVDPAMPPCVRIIQQAVGCIE